MSLSEGPLCRASQAPGAGGGRAGDSKGLVGRADGLEGKLWAIPCRVTQNHLCRHHAGHIGTGPHSHSQVNSHRTHSDAGYDAAHSTCSRHSHNIHSSVDSTHHGITVTFSNSRNLHRASQK